jgi:hypothetical protein
VTRVKQLMSLAPSDHPVGTGITNALLSLLSIEDAATVLLDSLAPNRPLRDGAVKRICRASADHEHIAVTTLVRTLEQRLAGGPASQRNATASALVSIARTTPNQGLRVGIQKILASSPFAPIRRRSYALHDSGIPGSTEILQSTWLSHRDKEAAWLVTKDCPVDFLLREHDQIVAALPERWMRARYVLRVSNAAPDVLDAFRSTDPVHAMYVYAKRKELPTEAILRSLIDESLGDPDLDLLVWSLGVLGLWGTLVELHGRADAIMQARLKRLHRTICDGAASVA